ncbi:prefoldin subunit alpha [Candidatus Woesearchaeota archaeon]|nr:prefoldin subunit alpha [Candidatus Woesearchaeota archaeon]
MLNEKDVQEKFQQFQVLQQHIEQISEQVKLMNQHNLELDASLEAVKGLDKMMLEMEVLTPLANGIFLKTRLQDNNTLLVNVGADTVVEKKAGEVSQLLSMQKQEILLRIAEAENLLQQLSEQANKIYQEVEENVR